MTVVNLDALRRGDLAERLLPKALELAGLVHGDGDAEAIGHFLRSMPQEERDALPIILAALVDLDKTPVELLAFVTWDEFGRRLDPDDHRVWDDCGTPRADWRHKYHGHRAQEIEACGCGQVGRDYWNARNAARKAAAREDEAGAAA